MNRAVYKLTWIALTAIPVVGLVACSNGDVDADADGVPSALDCNDEDAGLGSPQLLYIDNDQDGFGDGDNTILGCPPDHPDAILDATDCDDNDPMVHPQATEVCDGVDNDCDALVDDADPSTSEDSKTTYYVDADQDGFGDERNPMLACTLPEGYSTQPGDCNDGDDQISPVASEICNQIDDDCDGLIDTDDESLDTTTLRTLYLDTDGDGFGIDDSTMDVCDLSLEGYASTGEDCDDGDANVYPGATELCDGKDTDCDAETVEMGLASFEDVDGARIDITADLEGTPESPAVFVVPGSGTLNLCSGTWYASIRSEVSITVTAPSGPDSTTLSGGMAVVPLDLGGQTRSTATVNHLRIVNGHSSTSGGCLASNNVDLAVQDVSFSNCSSDDAGGALYADSSAATLSGVTFSNNSADDGAAIALHGGTFVITDADVTQSVAAHGSGGGVFATGAASGSIVNSELRSNSGGALTVQDAASVELRDSIIASNTAARGAGFSVTGPGSLLEIIDSHIEDNIASVSGGGGQARLSATLSVMRTTLERNVARGEGTGSSSGGGILCEDSTMTATEARFSENDGNDNGGGLGLDGCSLSATDVTLTSNSADRVGGAIHADDGTDAVFSGGSVSNNSSIAGGGIYVTGNSTVEFSDFTLEGNTSAGSSGNDGGGLRSEGNSDIVLTDCEILDNSSTGGGGGVATNGGSLTLVRTTFRDNSSLASRPNNSVYTDVGGGGLRSSDTEVSMTDVEFTDCTAAHNGGAVIFTGAMVEWTGGTVSNNQAARDGGGAVFYDGADIQVSDVQFTSNFAGDDGGGVYSDNVLAVELDQCLFTENEAGDQGGGLRLSRSRVVLDQTTISQNLAQVGGGITASALSVTDRISSTDSQVSENTADDLTLLLDVPTNYTYPSPSSFTCNADGCLP